MKGYRKDGRHNGGNHHRIRTISVEQAARALGIRPYKVSRMMRYGYLPYVTFGANPQQLYLPYLPFCAYKLYRELHPAEPYPETPNHIRTDKLLAGH